GGLGNQTNSWVGSGQNQPVSPSQLGQALGPNIIKTLSQMTGVSEDELTKQLSQGIPVIVNTMTPNGRLPTVAELSKMIE
ncbi:MAG: YidB family protein, partial [Xanthobacteraceae bacterium]